MNEYGALPVDPPYDTARTTALYCPVGSAVTTQLMSTLQLPEPSTVGFPMSTERIESPPYKYTSNS